MAHTSEYEVETFFIDRLESIGYSFVEMHDYDDVISNFREQLAKFNAKKLAEKGHGASFSDSEFNRIMIHVDNHSVYESSKILRDKYVLQLDDGQTVYIDFFSSDIDRNIYQVTHQVTMDKDHKDDVVYKNRYDVTVLINGLPVVQIELKRPGVEINEAINQINRYRKFSFKGLFRYLQLFVVSNSVQTKYFCNENEMMNGTSIEERPEEVMERIHCGHWEIDTVVGRKKGRESVVLTILEKASDYYLAIKIPGKNADAVMAALEVLREEFGAEHFPEIFRTITSDNGSEFERLSELEDYGTTVYFAHPYSSWERAQNERHNRILRRFIPKGVSIELFSAEQILEYADEINALPRRHLGYSTPEEVFDTFLDQVYSVEKVHVVA